MMLGMKWLEAAFKLDQKGIITRIIRKAEVSTKKLGRDNYIDLGLTNSASDYTDTENGRILLEFTLRRITNSDRLFKCKIAWQSASLRDKGAKYVVAKKLWTEGQAYF